MVKFLNNTTKVIYNVGVIYLLANFKTQTKNFKLPHNKYTYLFLRVIFWKIIVIVIANLQVKAMFIYFPVYSRNLPLFLIETWIAPVNLLTLCIIFSIEVWKKNFVQKIEKNDIKIRWSKFYNFYDVKFPNKVNFYLKFNL